MARIYSKRLMAGAATGGLSETVPEGYLWVVRNWILFWNGDSDPGTEYWQLSIEPSEFILSLGGPLSGGDQVVERIDSRQVLNAGESLSFAGTTATWYVCVSGYELTTP